MSAQTDTIKAADEVIINGRHYQAVDDKKNAVKNKKKTNPEDSLFIINNNKFYYYNNWLTLGGGVQQNLSYGKPLGFVGGMDFNFHVKKNYFQAGGMLSGPKFSYYDNYSLHLCYGKRFEDKDYHFAAFLGLSYSTGNLITQIDTNKFSVRPFSKPGLFIEGEVVKKITYDVGAGFCLFADWNQAQSMAGLRFILYFSGSYNGKKVKDYKDY